MRIQKCVHFLFTLCCYSRLEGSPVLSGLRRLSYFLGAARTADFTNGICLELRIFYYLLEDYLMYRGLRRSGRAGGGGGGGGR